MLINNLGKAISRLKIAWNIIFKTDIRGYMRLKIIKSIIYFLLIRYDFIILFSMIL